MFFSLPSENILIGFPVLVARNNLRIKSALANVGCGNTPTENR
jgi:hypothetical protein